MEPSRDRLRIVSEPSVDPCSDCVVSCLTCFVRGCIYLISFIIAFIPLTWCSCAVIIQEYERAVFFRWGKYQGIKMPGFNVFLPLIDKWVKVDVRVQTVNLPTQEMLTKESVTVEVNAILLYRIKDTEECAKAIINVQNPALAVWEIAQTTLRDVIGESELDHLLANRDGLNARLLSQIDKATDPWGIKVETVEVKDVRLPKNMRRVFGVQAEAERERRAKIISAEGEMQAAEPLLKAAMTLSRNPASMQLRYLETLCSISAEKNSTVVFPLPLEFLRAFDRNPQKDEIIMLESKKDI